MAQPASLAQRSALAQPSELPSGLLASLQQVARGLGFADLAAVSLDPDLLAHSTHQLAAWIDKGYAGDMTYLQRHLSLRAQPQGLLPGAKTALVVTLNYLSQSDWQAHEAAALADPGRAVVSVYARGRDYHKVVRAALARLGEAVGEHLGPFGYRACVDSAPVLEVSLAQAAGLGWRGKNTLLLNREQGSMFFLGVLLTDLPIEALTPLTRAPAAHHCGSCTACLTACPTKAFVGPYELDARRCISYLTIEHSGDLEESIRPLLGNRLYGCDDCQRVCPWNKYAQLASHPDFQIRHGLDQTTVADLLTWRHADFQRVFRGSAVLRIGYARWLRNLAVVAGNGLRSLVQQPPDLAGLIRQRLQDRRTQLSSETELSASESAMVGRHLDWALAQESGQPSP